MNPTRRVARLLPRALRTRLAVTFAAAIAVVIAAGVGLLAYATDRQFDAAVDTGLATRGSALQQALLRGDVGVVRLDPLAELVTGDGTVEEVSPGAASLRAGSSGASPSSTPSVSPSVSDAATSATSSGSAGRSAGRTSFLPAAALAQARALGTSSGSLEVRREGRVRYLATSVDVPEAGSVLVVGTRMDELDEAEARLVLLFLAGAPVAVAGLGLAGWLLAGAALRPVADLTRRAGQISAAQVGQRLPQPPGGDEVAVLAQTLNGMLGRLEAGVQREREFVDDAAHELRTPIAVLRGELELALRLGRELPEEVRESVAAALGEAERLEHLAQDLLVLASAEHGASPRAPVELLALARREVPRLVAAHPVVVEVVGAAGQEGAAPGEEVVVDGDERALSRLLANLVTNAEAAGATRVHVRVRSLDGSPGEGAGAELVVADDGRGFPPELAATATERFTRGDAARTRSGTGAGLGLAIVAAVVSDHGGTMALGRDDALGGASVRVVLPATAAG